MKTQILGAQVQLKYIYTFSKYKSLKCHFKYISEKVNYFPIFCLKEVY